MPHRYKGMNEGGGPATLTFLTYDIMETNYGDWFTISQLTAQVRLMRPKARADSVNRAVWRMLGYGAIEQDTTTKPSRFRVPTRDYWQGEDTG
jgi:hypothetical protein